jgi:hypothetical protein
MEVVMQTYPPGQPGQSATICECQWKDGDTTLIVPFHFQNKGWPLLGVVVPTGNTDLLPRMYP